MTDNRSIFEKIAERDISGFIVWEDEKHVAFLDIAPPVPGSTLVVPKSNIGDYVFGLEDKDIAELMLAAKKVAHILEERIECDRIVTIFEGFDVPHVHAKLYPAKKGQLKLAKADGPAEQSELEAMHRQITG